MEEVSLSMSSFANYKKSGMDKDGNVVYSRLQKSIIPNHKIYNPNKEESESVSTIHSSCCLFRFVMSPTSLPMARMLKVLLTGT